MTRNAITRGSVSSRAITRTKKSLRRPETSGGTSRGPKRDVAPRRDSARKREHSRKRNPLRGLAIVTGEGVGLGVSARENPGVTNFATPGFKWRGQDSNLRPRGYEPRELPGCSTARRWKHFYRTCDPVPVIESRFPADCSKSVSKTHTSWANVNAVGWTA